MEQMLPLLTNSPMFDFYEKMQPTETQHKVIWHTPCYFRN